VKLGGISFPNGCNIYSDHYKLKIREYRGRTKFEIVTRRIWKIHPFLLLFPVFDILLFVGPAIFLFIIALIPEETTTAVTGGVEAVTEMLPAWAIDILAFLVFFLYMFLIIKIVMRSRKWHGCEHKLIAAAEGGKIFDAKEFPTTHDRCGTTYMLSILALLVTIFLLFRHPLLTPIGIFMFMEARYFHDYNKPGILFGRLIQHFNALEPENYKLHVGMKGVNELMKLENNRQ
jgi:uncharacterized protein YqhQ